MTKSVKMPSFNLTTHATFLPYITLNLQQKFPLSFFIDTGSNDSFIDPESANQIECTILPISTSITTALNRFKIEEKAIFPMPHEFKTEGQITLLKFKFHSYFNGLILQEVH